MNNSGTSPLLPPESSPSQNTHSHHREAFVPLHQARERSGSTGNSRGYSMSSKGDRWRVNRDRRRFKQDSSKNQAREEFNHPQGADRAELWQMAPISGKLKDYFKHISVRSCSLPTCGYSHLENVSTSQPTTALGNSLEFRLAKLKETK